MSNAIIVRNTIPSEMVVLSEQVMADVGRLTATAAVMVVTSQAQLIAGNEIFREIDSLTKQISAQRLELTRPLDAVKAQAMEAERQATGPLLKAKEELGRQLALFAKQEAARVAEEEQKKREEAERIAWEARTKAEAERQKIIAEQNAARMAEEERRREEAAMFGTVAEPVKEQPAPPPVVIVPTFSPVRTAPAAPMVKPAARITERAHVVITDATAIIAEACKTGGLLYGRPVLKLDESAISEMVLAGVKIPGTAIEMRESVGSNGGKR
jgi:hypothetical protein